MFRISYLNSEQKQITVVFFLMHFSNSSEIRMVKEGRDGKRIAFMDEKKSAYKWNKNIVRIWGIYYL